MRTHGCAGKGKVTPEYEAWLGMIRRCEKVGRHRYDRYGGRGINVCQRWRASFPAFLEDMGARPTAAHSLDRVRGNDGYWCGKPECPECGPLHREPNCRWATRHEQGRNKCNNRVIEFRGERRVLAEWGEITGLGAHLIQSRLGHGWDVERALTTPVNKRLSHRRTG